MVILLADRKSKNAKEIIEILKKYGADHICEGEIEKNDGCFTIVTIYKKCNINVEKAITVYTDNTKRFKEQEYSSGIIGICEENNTFAFKNFQTNCNTVITCGANQKNTITFSSASENIFLVSFQRTIINPYGKHIEPCELKIELTKKYSCFAVMVCACVLLLKGIKPKIF